MTTFAWPTLTLAGPRERIFALVPNTQVFTSPLSGSVQTLEMPGAKWKASFTLENLYGADAGKMRAFVAKLRGRANSFTLHDMGHPVPRGTCALSGVTLGAAATAGATTVNLAGCGAGATLLEGDYIGVGGELKIVVADCTADGSGAMTGVTFEPPSRADWSNGTAVVTNKPTAVFMFTDDTVDLLMRAPFFSDVPIQAIERL